tara:strand:+ start:741 stop:938 length:198 start_codon:yes stop_codon:yes gene_type:complete
MGEIAPRGKKKETDFEQLLKYARHFEAEQIWLIRMHPEQYLTEYNQGVLQGIKRIVDLIDRQNKA